MINRILLVLHREYFSRVKKKSFLIMTFLTPLLFVLFYALIIFVMISQQKSDKQRSVLVYDVSQSLEGKLQNLSNISFSFTSQYLDISHPETLPTGYFGYLIVPQGIIERGQSPKVQFFSEESLSLMEESKIEDAIEAVIFEEHLKEVNIDKELIAKAKADITIETKKISDEGVKASSSAAATGVGFAGAILIYMFIFMYGVQVMRGVIEEKTNRIVEVIISSVRPFELMMGKIIGIALVGLTQLLLWVFLTLIITSVGSGLIGMNISPDSIQQAQQMPGGQNMNQGLSILNGVLALPLWQIVTAFIFYFVGGYLFYSALFAAIGSAVDSETDTQQFMLPVTIPLVFGFIIAQSVVASNPHGALAVWTSIIPLTSPVVMMVRMPFEPPLWQVAVSMVSLVIGFIFTTWLAARIYRTGILMYGKKVTWKELGKWLFYKG